MTSVAILTGITNGPPTGLVEYSDRNITEADDKNDKEPETSFNHGMSDANGLKGGIYQKM